MPKGPRVKLFARIFLKFIYSSVDISNAVAGWKRSCALTVIFCGFLSLGYLISTILRDGPLENLWGGGGGRAKYKKNIRAREN